MSEYVVWHELTHVLQAYIKSDRDPASGPPADALKLFGMSHESHACFVPVIASGGRHTPKCEAPLLTKHLRPGHRRPYQNWLWMLFVHEKGEETGLFSKVWHGYTAHGLHPFEVIKREKKLDAAAFADFWFEHALRNVTGDYKIPNVRNAIAAIERGKDRDKLTVRMLPVSGQRGTFTVPAEFVPQRFGYNQVLLQTLAGEEDKPREIQVELKGDPSQDKNADWRFGFCVIDADGKPRYTKPSTPGQTARVNLAADDNRVYLVVMAATGVIEPFSKDDPDDEEIPRYPYAVRIRGATPEVTEQASRE